MLDRMPADTATVALAVELALAPKTPRVAAVRLPQLSARTARLSLSSPALDRRLIACVVAVRVSRDAACDRDLNETARGNQGTALDRVRVWVTQRLMGGQPADLPIGWESEVTGSTALEVATWPELPASSRLRLIEPQLGSTDPGVLISSLATLQTIPGPEALAVWRRLSSNGGPTYPGARTQILVGLARHGDPDSLTTLEPHLGQLSVSDRLILATGRAERREASGFAELVSLVNTGGEHEAIRAAEALAALGGSPSIETRVRTWVRDGSFTMRERWLAAAARLNLGATPEVVLRLTSQDEAVRLAAAVAVAAAAAGSGPSFR